MFGKKKTNFPGLPVMPYEGLPGFDQNLPAYLNHSESGVVFFKANSTITATIPYTKLLNFEVMPEKDYMLKYHNEQTSASKIGAEKWYILIHYTGESESKHVSFWVLPGPKLNAVKAELKLAFEHATPQSYTL